MSCFWTPPSSVGASMKTSLARRTHWRLFWSLYTWIEAAIRCSRFISYKSAHGFKSLKGKVLHTWLLQIQRNLCGAEHWICTLGRGVIFYLSILFFHSGWFGWILSSLERTKLVNWILFSLTTLLYLAFVLLQNIKDNLECLGEQVAGLHERQPDAIRDSSPAEVAQIADALTQLNAEWDRLNRMYNHRKGYAGNDYRHRL